jgi:hypothetical protein
MYLTIREQNIRRNAEALAQIGVSQAAQELSAELAASREAARAARAAAAASRRASRDATPTRTSARAATRVARTPARLVRSGEGELAGLLEDTDEPLLRPAEDTFDATSVANAVRVTGHYTGWVKEEQRVAHGIPAQGFKPTVGGKGSIPSGFTKNGTSIVREKTAGMMRTNPNAFLYRHCFPGVKQILDKAWTKAEVDLFVEVAREHGCGDKWGLFSSHIPGRVGYQCSNAYRAIILPQCLVIDPNYRFTPDGEAMYRPPGSKRHLAPKRAGTGARRRAPKRRRRDYSSSEAESSSDSDDSDLSDLASDDDAPVRSSSSSTPARVSSRPQRTRRTPARLTVSAADRVSDDELSSEELLEKVKRASMTEAAAETPEPEAKKSTAKAKPTRATPPATKKSTRATKAPKTSEPTTPPSTPTGRSKRQRKPVERIRLSAFKSPNSR